MEAVLAWLGYINLALLVFNLLPALPLDGGRVLRAALWARSGNLAAATHRATRVSSVLAVVLIALGMLEVVGGVVAGLWVAVIGWFVLEAGRGEERRVATRNALGDLEVSGLMTVDPIAVNAASSLAMVAGQLHGTSRHTAYPVVDGGVVVGVFPLRAYVEQPPSEWGLRTVRQSMIPIDQVPRFVGSTPAMEASAALVAAPVGRGLVFEDGRLVGILSITDVARALEIGQAL